MTSSSRFAWLKRLAPGAAVAPPREWLRTGLGGCLALGGALWLCCHLFGLDAVLRIAPPFAASALLVFAVASSPLAQPWPVFAGNLLSAAIGLAAGHWLGHDWMVATAAMSASIVFMFALRCLHPPSCAVAFGLALGGPMVEQQGMLLLWPVALLSLGLIVAAMLINNLTGSNYPRQLARVVANPHHTRDPLPSQRLEFNQADLDQALAEFGGFVDVTREDLSRLLHATERHAERRLIDGVTAADIMSRDVRTVGPQERMSRARELFRHYHIKALPVLDERRALVGILTQSDLLTGLYGGSRLGRLAFGSPNVAQVMSTPVETVRLDTPLTQLVWRLSDEGLHCLPVLDEQGGLAGIVSQTDLIAALHHRWLQDHREEEPATDSLAA
ncbi:HPP family protein [Pseudomonas jinjuensis]|uniref:CBS domain-containing membrane protein n=1 Tax=Pseudomonas jinjuensis TaxID=198616 RepID=A0A1H0NYL0_9PSED|nr:HPP family protein [Pseudomonas jinjuensis]SDO97872.1 CBS domain-containing membrane protein [Pseudomonas jinjuensis]